MTEKSKEYVKKLDEQRRGRTPEQNSMANKLAEIVNIISDKMTPEERGEAFNGKFNSTDELVDNYLDFIKLTVGYMIYDLEATRREAGALRQMLDERDVGNDNDDLMAH